MRNSNLGKITLCKIFFVFLLSIPLSLKAQQITANGQPAELDIRESGQNSIRVTLKPISYEKDFPFNPGLNNYKYPNPKVRLREITNPVKKKVGDLYVDIIPDPLTLKITNLKGQSVQTIVFNKNGHLSFNLDDQPVLGMGEGGPKVKPHTDWRKRSIEYDRRGRFFKMQPRWQSNAYGSRNPVPMLIGTAGWAIFVASPWVQVDLTHKDYGTFIPVTSSNHDYEQQNRENQQRDEGKGLPPPKSIIPGLYDFFVFDAHDPKQFMKNVSELTGPAVMPPEWALGYMQSHRTIRSYKQMINIVDTFRSKKLPIDAVIYLGTGFAPRGWNKSQPSFEFNPQVFRNKKPSEVISDLHERHVKVVLHMVPWDRDKLPTLYGSIPPKPGHTIDNSHIEHYWKEHIPLVRAGVDAFWPDEGDWFNLFERMERQKMYYQGPLSTKPGIRPWSLHRNGYLGIDKWGGWVWSGDTQSSWKTLQTQIAVGINYSLSLSPYWGSDIGGFFPDSELTGELYARWYQFGAFCPSFRAHGKTWWTRLPWGWGLHTMGPLENGPNEPLVSSLNNSAIEGICQKYDDLRYQLLSYNYTLAWQARSRGLPLMRAMWLEFPSDTKAKSIGDQFMWGSEMLIAPVYKKGAESRDVYLPKGLWYDWWNNKKLNGGQTIIRNVNLSIMPIYVRAGSIIPFDPVRQYTGQKVDKPLMIKVFRGADGQYTLYEDDGYSQKYLKGMATWTGFKWHNSDETLTVKPKPPKGYTNHNTTKRVLNIELLPDEITKTVYYTGKNLNISF